MCDKKGLEAGRQPWTYCVWRSCVDNLENMPQVLRRDLDERLVAIMGACGGTGVNKTPRLVLKAVHGNPLWNCLGPSHPLRVPIQVISLGSGPILMHGHRWAPLGHGVRREGAEEPRRTQSFWR